MPPARSVRATADPVRCPGTARLPLVPPAQDRHDRRGRGGDHRRGGARRGRPPPAPPRDRLGRPDGYRRSRAQLPALRCPLRARDPAARTAREPLDARERVAGWYTERLEHLVATPSAGEGDRHGWQAYVIGLDRRDEALEGFAPRASRHRSARTPSTTCRPTSTAVRSPAPTRHSGGRSRCRSRRRRPRTRSIVSRWRSRATPGSDDTAQRRLGSRQGTTGPPRLEADVVRPTGTG